jgi:hypothetical protein
MPRTVAISFSGRPQEGWVSEDGGMMDAYGIGAWFDRLAPALQADIAKAVLSDRRHAQVGLRSGPFSAYRAIIERHAWIYGETPPFFESAFGALCGAGQGGAALAVLDEWLDMSRRTASWGQHYAAHCAAVEFYWRDGYESAKAIRQSGLHNDKLKKVMAHAVEATRFLRQRLLPAAVTTCKPLDRLFLLYKLTGQAAAIEAFLGDLAALGYGHLEEVQAWRAEIEEDKRKAAAKAAKKAAGASSPRGGQITDKQAGRADVTLSQYQRMAMGMSYAEVASIIGAPGEEQVRSQVASIETVMYKWASPSGANMSAMFQNDRLVQKAQSGLK